MPAAPLLGLYEKVVKDAWRAWAGEWNGPLIGHTQKMESHRRLGGNRLRTWDSRYG
jgi:hypothetical protein